MSKNRGVASEGHECQQQLSVHFRNRVRIPIADTKPRLGLDPGDHGVGTKSDHK